MFGLAHSLANRRFGLSQGFYPNIQSVGTMARKDPYPKSLSQNGRGTSVPPVGAGVGGAGADGKATLFKWISSKLSDDGDMTA